MADDDAKKDNNSNEDPRDTESSDGGMVTADLSNGGSSRDNDDAPPIPPLLAPTDEKRSSGGRTIGVFFIIIFTLLVAAAVVVAMEPGLRARALALFDAARGTSEDTTMQRLDHLSSRLSRVDGALANLHADVPGLAARLDGLEKKFGEKNVATLGTETGGGARLDRLEARAKILEDRLKALAAAPVPHKDSNRDSGRDGNLGALALVAFAATLDAGRPFAPLVPFVRGALKAAAADGAVMSLDRLLPYAQKGVPPAAVLSMRLQNLGLVTDASRSPQSPVPAKDASPVDGPANAGVWEKIKARLSGLVSIRRVGDVSSPPASLSSPGAMPGNPLRPAARMIDGGDLTGALSALEALDQSRLGSEGPAHLAVLIADLKARQIANHLAAALVPVIARASAPKP
jgi:hypothetical protein